MSFQTQFLKFILCFLILLNFSCDKSKSNSKTTGPIPGQGKPSDGQSDKVKPEPGPFINTENFVSLNLQYMGNGIGLIKNNSSQQWESGYLCVEGKAQTELLQNPTRYTLFRTVQAFKSPLDNQVWHRIEDKIEVTVLKKKTTLTEPTVREAYKKLSAEEFTKRCGDNYISATYSHARLYLKYGYDIDSTKLAPAPVDMTIDNNDNQQLNAMNAKFSEFREFQKNNESADSRPLKQGTQNPGLLSNRDDLKDLTLVQQFQLYAKLASETNLENFAPAQYFEVLDYSKVKK